MIGYVTLGSNNIEALSEFYNELFTIVGATRIYDVEKFKAWSKGENGPFFSIVSPYDGNEATVGNGVMIALLADSPEQVDELHAKALSMGAENEGDPGLRSGGYYCAYFRDLDGNKLNFHVHQV